MTVKRLFLALGLLLAPLVTYSKTETPTKLIPVDPELRTGRLPNGLTYYVRHNGEPRGQACFHLVQNAGSILEEDNERGFAHFMEHMSFNGTVHFPGNTLISWLQKQGVKVGNDLNARTKIDETIYSIDNVPSGRKSVLDSCLLIIHDWCTGVTFDDGEVEKERGVILEELRTHRHSEKCGGIRVMILTCSHSQAGL